MKYLYWLHTCCVSVSKYARVKLTLTNINKRVYTNRTLIDYINNGNVNSGSTFLLSVVDVQGVVSNRNPKVSLSFATLSGCWPLLLNLNFLFKHSPLRLLCACCWQFLMLGTSSNSLPGTQLKAMVRMKPSLVGKRQKTLRASEHDLLVACTDSRSTWDTA